MKRQRLYYFQQNKDERFCEYVHKRFVADKPRNRLISAHNRLRNFCRVASVQMPGEFIKSTDLFYNMS